MEVELEQAYIDIAMNGGTSFKAGLFLLPVGTLNETHEPDTFYGVERNPVEKNIIPTTWWEAGIGLSGSSESVSWDVAVHSGLAVPDSYKIRSGRKKVAEAPAEDAAVTGRVTYSGNGFKVAGFAQYVSHASRQTPIRPGGVHQLHGVMCSFLSPWLSVARVSTLARWQ